MALNEENKEILSPLAWSVYKARVQLPLPAENEPKNS